MAIKQRTATVGAGSAREGYQVAELKLREQSTLPLGN